MSQPLVRRIGYNAFAGAPSRLTVGLQTEADLHRTCVYRHNGCSSIQPRLRNDVYHPWSLLAYIARYPPLARHPGDEHRNESSDDRMNRR